MMDGILIVNKPKNYTSHDIVNIVRKVYGTKRVGHIGTLDPNATGVLVLCLNKATKLVKYFEQHNKTYVATIRLGVLTDSDDVTGRVLETADTSHITSELIQNELNNFLGKQTQLPPKYSAVKVKGKKLYELARRDLKIPDLEPREIEVLSISNFKLLQTGKEVLFQIEMTVTKGTYIRSIARDLGERLGVYGTLEELVRTKIEDFDLSQSFSIEDLHAKKPAIMEPFQFMNLPKITLNKVYERYIENGRLLDPKIFPKKTDTIIYSETNEVLAIYYYDEQKDSMRMSVKWC